MVKWFKWSVLSSPAPSSASALLSCRGTTGRTVNVMMFLKLQSLIQKISKNRIQIHQFPQGKGRIHVLIQQTVKMCVCHLCLQRLRNLMIFLAAWSCFFVKNDPLMDTKSVSAAYNQSSVSTGRNQYVFEFHWTTSRHGGECLTELAFLLPQWGYVGGLFPSDLSTDF